MSIVTIGTDFDTYLCRVINHAANDASGTDVAETSTVDLIAYLGLFLSPPSLSLSLSLFLMTQDSCLWQSFLAKVKTSRSCDRGERGRKLRPETVVGKLDRAPR